MILLQKVIIYHSDKCERNGLKNKGCAKYESFDTIIEFDSIEKLELHRKQIQNETKIKDVDFIYIEQ